MKTATRPNLLLMFSFTAAQYFSIIFLRLSGVKTRVSFHYSVTFRTNRDICTRYKRPLSRAANGRERKKKKEANLTSPSDRQTSVRPRNIIKPAPFTYEIPQTSVIRRIVSLKKAASMRITFRTTRTVVARQVNDREESSQRPR